MRDEKRPKTDSPTALPLGAGRVRCLDCARARREGRDHGCLVHVAEDLFP